jgi:hypothetical protein
VTGDNPKGRKKEKIESSASKSLMSNDNFFFKKEKPKLNQANF